MPELLYSWKPKIFSFQRFIFFIKIIPKTAKANLHLIALIHAYCLSKYSSEFFAFNNLICMCIFSDERHLILSLYLANLGGKYFQLST